MSYRDDAQDDAKEMIEYFMVEIVEKIKDGDEVSDDLFNDYSNGDSYHHENHTDKAYDLEDAAKVLSELDEFEETDNGLWEGLDPEKAICAKAAYTYGNAVLHFWREYIKTINEINLDEVVSNAIQEAL
jgi:hypothetical protein